MANAFTVRTYEMAVLDRINGANLYQGDRIDNFQTVLVGRLTFPDGHPLKAAGFLTEGYTLRFVAKPDVTLADDAPGVINVEMLPTDEDNAPLLILPAQTANIDFGLKTSIRYSYQIQISDGNENTYTLDWGVFTLLRDVAISA